jgi:hypothetical protein
MKTKTKTVMSRISVDASAVRGCDWPGCKAEAAHRAPRSRNELRTYRWFCLDHVRLYNAAWNYYAGMSETEIEADLRRDTVWQRPSWPIGSARGPEIVDLFGIFDGASPPPPPKSQASPQQDALNVLELSHPLTIEVVKARYKQLAKIHHPDANGGDKAAEERFKQITEAYHVIMEELSA